MRVASLTPSNTEIVAFLGCTDALVGVDDWSDWPPAVTDLPQLGPDLQIDVAALSNLAPDLVLSSLSVPGQEPVVASVEAAGLDQLVLQPKTLSEVRRDVVTVAEHLGVPERGRALAGAMSAELARLSKLTEGLDRPRVYWEWWPKPAIGAGGVGWMTEVMACAGAANVLADVDEESPTVDPSQLAQRAPDAIALCWQGSLHAVQSVERLQGRDGWGALAPVRQRRVHLMDEALFGRPGPRLVEGVRVLTASLHPALAGAVGRPMDWLPEGAVADERVGVRWMGSFDDGAVRRR